MAEKPSFVTIGDRSVTGMVARDQMWLAPWQVPVADWCGHYRQPRQLLRRSDVDMKGAGGAVGLCRFRPSGRR